MGIALVFVINKQGPQLKGELRALLAVYSSVGRAREMSEATRVCMVRKYKPIQIVNPKQESIRENGQILSLQSTLHEIVHLQAPQWDERSWPLPGLQKLGTPRMNQNLKRACISDLKNAKGIHLRWVQLWAEEDFDRATCPSSCGDKRFENCPRGFNSASVSPMFVIANLHFFQCG